MNYRNRACLCKRNRFKEIMSTVIAATRNEQSATGTTTGTKTNWNKRKSCSRNGKRVTSKTNGGFQKGSLTKTMTIYLKNRGVSRQLNNPRASWKPCSLSRLRPHASPKCLWISPRWTQFTVTWVDSAYFWDSHHMNTYWNLSFVQDKHNISD